MLGETDSKDAFSLSLSLAPSLFLLSVEALQPNRILFDTLCVVAVHISRDIKIIQCSSP